MPAASERMPISVGQTCGYPFGPGHLPVWATSGCCNLLHSQCNWLIGIVKGGFRQAFPQIRDIFWLLPSQNLLYLWVQYWQAPKFTLMGCDQSAVSGATDGGRQSSASMGCDQSMVLGFASVLESKLDSSKVTHLLGCMGLVEGNHLLAASPGQPSGKGVFPCISFYTFYFLSALYFLIASDCLIAPGYCAAHERQSSSAALCVPIAWPLWLAPSTEHSLLPLELPPQTPAVCPKSCQSGHRLPASGCGISPEQVS